ncbi:MAG: DMT family transporter [Planctomycetes bacterium]|nr:DMT family transporter [Planctomycetota bacterium]
MSESPLDNRKLKADLALLMAAIFWGTTFIVQREAMDFMSPLAYTGLRFTLGALALLPLALYRARVVFRHAYKPVETVKTSLTGCLVAGSVLFVGISLQQYGLVWTTAGKAGFITSLYVVLVPLIMMGMGRKILLGEGIGAFLAVLGLYLLSFTDDMTLAPGDGLVLAGAVVWAAHVLCVGWFSPKMDSIILGAGQGLVCGILALFGAAILGQIPSWHTLSQSWLTVLWGGIFSVTLGFTLQVIGQKNANPAAAAIILQMEAVIAAIAGWLVLEEKMTGRMLAGAIVMLAGMLVSQLWPLLTKKEKQPISGRHLTGK